jgi:hypothetical protein
MNEMLYFVYSVFFVVMTFLKISKVMHERKKS